MIFVDSSFFIAIADKKDQWHEKAKDISIKDVVVSDLVISEVLTEIGRREGGKAAHKVFNYFLDTCKIVYLEEESLLKAEEIFMKYDGRLSLADAVSITFMKDLGITRVVSFDSDFDKVQGIQRIHS